jgi:hypothetical protein
MIYLPSITMFIGGFMFLMDPTFMKTFGSKFRSSLVWFILEDGLKIDF